jgi:hypothetical protein
MARRPRQQRIEAYGQFRPTGVDDSAARRMQALAGLGATVAGVAEQFGRAKAEELAPAQAQEAVEQAITVDEEGQKVFGEVPTRKGWGSEVFNRNAVNAYLAEVSIDSDAKIKELEEKYKDNPEGFTNDANAYRQATVNLLPPESQPRINEALASRISSAEEKLNTKFLTDSNNKNIIILSNSIDSGARNIANLARDGNTELVNSESELLLLTMDALAEASPKYASIVDAEKRKLEKTILKETAIGDMNRIVFAENLSTIEKIKKGQAFLTDFRKKEISDLSPEEKDQYTNLIEAKVSSLQRALTQEETANRAAGEQIISNLDIAIGLDTLPTEDLIKQVEDAYENKYIDGKGRSFRVVKILKQDEASIKKNQGMTKVANQINGIAPVGDELPITQTDVNNYYNEVTFINLPDDPEQRSALQTEFVKRTGLVPAALNQELTNDLLSGDTDRIQAASETIDRLTAIAGIGQNVVTDQQRAFATEVSFLSQFMGADLATKQAQANTDPNDQARIESRESFIKSKEGKKTFNATYENELLEEYGEGFFEQFNNNELEKYNLINDYGKLVESYYIAGMSVGNAKTQAMKNIQSNYKKGEFGFMKFPPEDYYGAGPNNDTSYIREDIYNELTGPSGIFGIELNSENIILVSDDITARQASTGNPSYRVMYRDKNGTLNSAIFQGKDANGNEVQLDRYVPNKLTEEQEQAAIIKSKAQQDIKQEEVQKNIIESTSYFTL